MNLKHFFYIRVGNKEQLNDYKKIANSAKAMIERRKKKVKELDVISKVATYMSVKMNLAKDDGPKEVANMLIKGSNMGITQIKKHLEEYKLKNKNVINFIPYKSVNPSFAINIKK